MTTSPHQSSIQLACNTLVEDLDLQTILFTTYEYHHDIFCQRILPNLFDITLDNQGIETLSENDTLYRYISKKLQHKLAVFYDTIQPEYHSRTPTINHQPITIKNGVFHPKIIVVTGTKKKEPLKKEVRILVTSANLTLSGWGRNREVFAYCTIENKQMARDLSEFVTYLQAQPHVTQNTTEILKNIQQTLKPIINHGREEQYPKLLVTYPKIQGVVFSDIFPSSTQNKSNFYVCSPYFGGVEKRLQEPFFQNRTVYIIPAIQNNISDLSPSAIDAINKDTNLQWAAFTNSDITRFDHLKLYSDGTYTMIGSHNFTDAALSHTPKNVEISLIFKDVFPSGMIQTLNRAPQPQVDKSKEPQPIDFNCSARVQVDWRESGLAVHVFEVQTNPKYPDCTIKLFGKEIPYIEKKYPFNFFCSDITSQQDLTKSKQYVSELLKDYPFFIITSDAGSCTGLIEELNHPSRPYQKIESIESGVDFLLSIVGYQTNYLTHRNRTSQNESVQYWDIFDKTKKLTEASSKIQQDNDLLETVVTTIETIVHLPLEQVPMSYFYLSGLFHFLQNIQNQIDAQLTKVNNISDKQFLYIRCENLKTLILDHKKMIEVNWLNEDTGEEIKYKIMFEMLWT